MRQPCGFAGFSHGGLAAAPRLTSEHIRNIEAQNCALRRPEFSVQVWSGLVCANVVFSIRQMRFVSVSA